MKFGLQLYDRATSKWRNYNIDYNELKTVIKAATTDLETTNSSCSSTSSNQTNNELSKYQKQVLKALYKSFQEQIDFVSLFVNSKVGEISRRVIALKRQCNMLIKSQADLNGDNDENHILKRVMKRKIDAYKKELDTISKDLQDLSKFILLQKIAIRKLFKKFLKHSSYSQKQQLVNKMTKNFLIDNQNAFTNVNLNNLSNELTLLFNFLYNFDNNNNTQKSKVRQASLHTLDSLKLPSNSMLNSSNNQSCNPLNSRIATFDIISKKKGPRMISFWVHYDNLEEIKIYLSREFSFITDESSLTDDDPSHQSDLIKSSSNLKLRNTKSSLNLAKKGDEQIYNDFDFTPETETVAIWLNNSKDPILSNSPTSSIDVVDNETKTFPTDPFPQILLSTPSLNSPILFTPIGGLRQFTIAPLDNKLIEVLFDDKIDDKEFLKSTFWNEYNKHQSFGNPKMNELSIDWVIDNDLRPISKIKSHRLRYIALNDSETSTNSNNNISSYISLDWDIVSTDENVKNLNNSDFENGTKFKYAVLEIHFDSNVNSLPKSVQQLINSHLVYQVDELNFNFNNYLVWSYLNKNISDNGILKFVLPWFEIYDNQDIRKIPSIEEPSDDLPSGILLNKGENQEQKQKQTTNSYWNEFDNGSDFGDDNNGFYIDTSTNFSDERNGPGLSWLSNSSMIKLLSLSNSLTKWFQTLKYGSDSLNKREHESLLSPIERHYSVYHVESEFDGDSDDGDDDDEGNENENDVYLFENIKFANHDRILSFIYMSCLILSYLLSGIGIGLDIGFRKIHHNLSWTEISIIGMSMFALLISVLLSVAGVCLILCRCQNAPVWHHVFIWSGVLFSSIMLISGIILVL